ncbi:hypothetical protein [Methylophilus sp. YYY-1]|uniref:hypothetical protein n=1 Tax=Methylophilus sp. YYY-1 TaxID=2682087 RepID=UPI0023B26172|nr:hypothetical protein [Methylophilus sp. YYY-1]MDF0378736.1 hypothetical protein [Methylophilus sp. YYY-1]
MTTMETTIFGKLNAEHRLQNPVFKDATKVPGRFGFRGELAIKFAAQLADEARPPEITCDQVMAYAQEGESGMPFFTGYLLSFGYLELLVEALKDVLLPEGKYIVFCNNIDLLKKYTVKMNGSTFYVLPIDEATVYNELLELLRLEKNDLKKLDTGAKLDAVIAKAMSFSANYPEITYEEGLQLMGPVRNPNENRPV